MRKTVVALLLAVGIFSAFSFKFDQVVHAYDCVDPTVGEFYSTCDDAPYPVACSWGESVVKCCATGTDCSEFLEENPDPIGAEDRAEHVDPTRNCGSGEINTAIGCIPVNDTKQFTVYILKWLMGIGGGVALVLIVYSGFLVMTSSGDPRKAQAGKELMTAAVSGLVLLALSAFILEFIGVDLLGILK